MSEKEKRIEPTEIDVEKMLGDSYAIWLQLCEHHEKLDNISYEWKMYTKKVGWTMLIKQKKRTLYYMIPSLDKFMVSFVFGERAVQVISESEIDKALIEQLLNARKYMEGRGLQVEVENNHMLDDIIHLIQIKIEN
ncbi:putative membrane protein [Breznakia sp. PF5-3]|uniref:DUF3788 family protein n=1 Tax=unclassified Breznakia TaxID=2623764 RepID=UPI0024061E22|nr:MULTISPECIES: DUF3788 family protein [unclassified Breznakia]MDF9824185.1 putative membrane protein [Breznakia sp. PM6-1]MDF9834983.1 putative membrane protein [Breznakia sp. PF5-3]MDF9837228.1 putative membrane protein [Breznakia sp. PFB2-8]MDF9859218.1 putative membrane protein [Breznakia sp. PH5-24]